MDGILIIGEGERDAIINRSTYMASPWYSTHVFIYILVFTSICLRVLIQLPVVALLIIATNAYLFAYASGYVWDYASPDGSYVNVSEHHTVCGLHRRFRNEPYIGCVHASVRQGHC